MGENELIRVLLVDDDEDDGFLIRDLLSESEEHRFELVWVKSFDEAIQHIGDPSYSLFLFDYRLGQQTGLELLQHAIVAAPNTPVIMLTGFNDKDVDWRAIREGADDYLAKNGLSAEGLLRSIRYALARAENKAARKALETQLLQQDRLASLGLLASSLAHEIGTPLGIIRGRAELLELKLKDNPEAVRGLDVIVTQIDRVAKLIRSLLNLARGATTDGQKLVVHLADVVRDVTDLISGECQKEGINVNVRVDTSARVQITTEGESLQQVLLNLVVNSIHSLRTKRHVDAQAKKVDSELEYKIDIQVSVANKEVITQVIDNGIGVSPENMKNLFKPFFTTKEIGEGTGLGLATSFRIVDSWGGRMDVQSQQGRGATFRIILPLYK